MPLPIIINPPIQIWAILAALVHMGNVNFCSSSNEGSRVTEEAWLTKAAELFQITADSLKKALCRQTVAAGGSKGDIVHRHHDANAAAYTRDALAKVTRNRFSLA